MDELTIMDLNGLLESIARPAVSIYMPAHPVQEIQQDPIRLKNLLASAEEQAIRYGLRAPEARRMLEPARRLLADDDFWQHQSNGLAVFLSADSFSSYRLDLDLPELLVVSEHFHIRPLLPLFTEDGLFYVLAISQNEARLLRCSRDRFRDVTPKKVLAGLSEALKYDDPQKQHQFHTTGQGPAVFHGQGASRDLDKNAILRYFQKVDDGLHDLLKEQHAPLILASVDYLHSIYRSANSYHNLLENGLEGNYDGITDSEIHEQAWRIVGPLFDSCRRLAVERYREAAGTGITTADIEQALTAALDGRIDTLFADAEVRVWGRFDPSSRNVLIVPVQRPDS